MKRIFSIIAIAALVGAFASSFSFAQDAGTTSTTMHRFSIGPAVTAGACVYTGTVPDGFKTSAGLAWDAGALMYYSVNENFGFDLGIVYDSRTFNMHFQNDATTGADYTLSYIIFQPGFTVKDFSLGLGIGIPQSSSYVPKLTGTTGSTQTINASDLRTVVELRLGASVPVLESATGSLRFLINASYPFGNTFTNSGFKNNDDGPIAALKAGFSYQFNVGGN